MEVPRYLRRLENVVTSGKMLLPFEERGEFSSEGLDGAVAKRPFIAVW